MFRKYLATLIALFLVVGGLIAEEIKGVFKSFDKDNNKVTIKVGDKEQTYKVDPTAKVNIKFKYVKKGKEKDGVQSGEANIPLPKVLANYANYKDDEEITLTIEKDILVGSSHPPKFYIKKDIKKDN